jgi:flagellar biosynthesis protein FlhA
MARTLSNQYRDEDGILHVFTLSADLENMLREAMTPVENSIGFQLEASKAQQILLKTGEQMEQLAQLSHFPVLLCPREIRLAFRRLVEQSLPNLVVLAYSEVSPGTRVKAHGSVMIWQKDETTNV